MRFVACVLVVTAAVEGPALANAGSRGSASIGPTQELAVLLTAHRVMTTLGSHSSFAGVLQAHRPITGERTVVPVIGRVGKTGRDRWLRILLPGRPNGKTGWIRQQGTTLTATSWHLVVETSHRRVLVYRLGHLVRSFAAVVGKPSTPTPRGRFFVEESVRMSAGSPGAPFALALSARSTVLQTFEGGSGQIAIHGVMNIGGTPGTAVSHGCVRLSDRDITWLAARISTGAPVTITG